MSSTNEMNTIFFPSGDTCGNQLLKLSNTLVGIGENPT